MAIHAERVELDQATADALRLALDEPDLASCIIDSQARLAVVTLNAGLQPEGWRLTELYPLHVALYPVGRVAVSHRVGDQSAGHPEDEAYTVRPLDVADLDQLVQSFVYRTVEDCDLFDPSDKRFFQSQDSMSLDIQLGNEKAHMLELWLDDAPLQLLNVGMWFNDLYLFDAGLRPVTVDDLVRWRHRQEEEMRRAAAIGQTIGLTSPASTQVSTANVLELIEGTDAGPTGIAGPRG